jgi:hypothetical protein
VRPKTRAVKPAGPIAYVLSLKLERRRLNAGQRAMVAANLATMRQGAPAGKKQRRQGGKIKPFYRTA